MYRIDNETSVDTIPTPAAIGPNPDSFFTNGDPNSGIPATIVEQDWANAVQEELCYVIEQSGATLSKTIRTQLLTAIKSFIQGGALNYAASTTSANTYTATLAPAPSAYAAGMVVFIKFTNKNTGAATINLNSLGAKNIKRTDGSALSAGDIQDGMMVVMAYDGTNFQLLNRYNAVGILNEEVSYAASTTAANTYTATMVPTPTAYVTGMRVSILFTNVNTGAATINLNSLGAKSIKRLDGAALSAGDIQSNMFADLRYDGTNFQLLDRYNAVGLQIEEANYTASTTAANTFTATLTPTPTAYTTGMRVSIKFTNANTGAATINLNTLGAKSMVLGDGTALSSGNIAAGMIADLRYDGTNFQLMNPIIAAYAFAAQADMEAASSTVTMVSPGVFKYHPGVVKVWGAFDEAGTIQASYNISSVTDVGTGISQPNYTTSFSSALYGRSVTLRYTGGTTILNEGLNTNDTENVGQTVIRVFNNTPAAADPNRYYFAAFGDQ